MIIKLFFESVDKAIFKKSKNFRLFEIKFKNSILINSISLIFINDYQLNPNDKKYDANCI